MTFPMLKKIIVAETQEGLPAESAGAVLTAATQL